MNTPNTNQRSTRIRFGARAAVGGLLLLATAAPFVGPLASADALAARHEFSGRAKITQTCQVTPFTQIVALAPGDVIEGNVELEHGGANPTNVFFVDASNHGYDRVQTNGPKTQFRFTLDVPTTFMACVGDQGDVANVTFTVYPAPYAQTNVFPVGGAQAVP